ncbi:MAG TPA: glycosyltransferase, partial [Candidatus Saccharibacteria bacterium]|nr:glycosyltransferase [Candidatus Saccharibacteria bacterium]
MIDASIYGIVALSRVAFQIGTSMLERREQYDEIEYPKATLVIACYNEPARLFERALQSFANQTYKDLEVIVVDDGSKNAGSIRRITNKYGFTYIYQKNAGKREAMFTAFKHMSKDSQVVLTADSDT